VDSRFSFFESGIPALDVRRRHARFALRPRIAPDPRRDVLLLEVALTGVRLSVPARYRRPGWAGVAGRIGRKPVAIAGGARAA